MPGVCHCWAHCPFPQKGPSHSQKFQSAFQNRFLPACWGPASIPEPMTAAGGLRRGVWGHVSNLDQSL